MKTHIALLRGINVTGHNKIKMTELKRLFESLGYYNVVTYIQSGNVIFQSKEKNATYIEQTIVETVEKQFGHTIKVLVLTKNELTFIFDSNPFIEKDENIDITKLHVTLLNANPEITVIPSIEKLTSATDDEFKIIEKTVYLYCPNGYGKTKLNNNLFEKKLKANATTRNWKTITKLVELSNQ